MQAGRAFSGSKNGVANNNIFRGYIYIYMNTRPEVRVYAFLLLRSNTYFVHIVKLSYQINL